VNQPIDLPENTNNINIIGIRKESKSAWDELWARLAGRGGRLAPLAPVAQPFAAALHNLHARAYPQIPWFRFQHQLMMIIKIDEDNRNKQSLSDQTNR
jgi:hypothetical protein